MVAPITTFRGPRYDLVVSAMAAPAAGAAITWSVPNKRIIEIVTFRIGLATSVIVADRLVYAMGISGGINFGWSPAIVLQPANTSWLYHIGVGLPFFDNTANNEYYGSLPSLFQLESGDSLRIGVNNIDAGDQIGSCLIRYMSWHEG